MFIPIVLSLEDPAGNGASELLLYCLSTYSLSLSVCLTYSFTHSVVTLLVLLLYRRRLWWMHSRIPVCEIGKF